MAKRRKLKCNKCDRTFSMAAHLARHQSTTHASKARKAMLKKKAAKRTRTRAAQRITLTGAGRQPASGFTGVIRDMRTYRNQLAAQRSELDSKITAVDQALNALGGNGRSASRPARGRRGGTVRKGSLKDYIGRVMKARGGSMAVKDVCTAVVKAGFKSKNKTLDKSVGTALSQMPNTVKVARGRYRLR